MNVQAQETKTKFNPSGEEHNLNQSALVVKSSGLKYFIELRTTALIDYILKVYSSNNYVYTRKSISDWLSARNRPGFYKELSTNLHLAYADQRDGHGTQHWWKLFFNDDYKPSVLSNIKIEINFTKSLNSEDNSNAQFQWGGLNFRSQSEVRIAHALYSQGILFFANSSAYINLKDLPISNANNQSQERVEIDFLVFYKQQCIPHSAPSTVTR